MSWFNWFRQPHDRQPSGRLVEPDDIVLAYRLILKRDPDEGGLEHLTGRIREGLRLEELISTLVASDEYAERDTHVGMPAVDATPRADRQPGNAIDPRDVMARVSLEELAQTADQYYSRITDTTPLMAKPFVFTNEAPATLENLGLVLAGLHLGRSMTVLDFGAGTCWLSRILAQLHCKPICCDVSESALAIGRKLLADYPPIGSSETPTFLPFDGRRIDLATASVDRVICFDAFHHVPNQREILSEFSRVIKPGGVVGFSEPGPNHSQSPQSQYEMRNHRVLENDIDLNHIFKLATDVGFTDVTVCAGATLWVPLQDYNALLAGQPLGRLERSLYAATASTLANKSIFFLHKGPLQLDSRTHLGLEHRLHTDRREYLTAADRVRVVCTITNSGTSHWLHTNTEIYGVVRLAAHLYEANGRLLEVDHFRTDLPQTVAPGQTIEMTVDVPLTVDGDCQIAFDLVAEGLCWFENLGSQPAYILVRRL